MNRRGWGWMTAGVLLFLFVHPVRAHYFSENIQWTKGSDFMLKTSLGWDITEHWSLEGAYYSGTNFKPKGGQFVLNFHHWVGWQGWIDYFILENESSLAIGMGHQQLLLWDDGAFGISGGLSRTLIKKAFQAEGTDIKQWEPMLNLTAEAGSDWVFTIDGRYYRYSLELSQDIIEQYGFLLEDREFMNSLYSDFIVYQVGMSVGFDGKHWGFYQLRYESVKTYSQGFMSTCQFMWMKNLFEKWDLSVNSQLTSDWDMLVGMEIRYNF